MDARWANWTTMMANWLPPLLSLSQLSNCLKTSWPGRGLLVSMELGIQLRFGSQRGIDRAAPISQPTVRLPVCIHYYIWPVQIPQRCSYGHSSLAPSQQNTHPALSRRLVMQTQCFFFSCPRVSAPHNTERNPQNIIYRSVWKNKPFFPFFTLFYYLLTHFSHKIKYIFIFRFCPQISPQVLILYVNNLATPILYF